MADELQNFLHEAYDHKYPYKDEDDLTHYYDSLKEPLDQPTITSEGPQKSIEPPNRLSLSAK